MGLAPWVLAKGGPNDVLTWGVDGKNDPAFIFQGAAQDDKPGFYKRVHEGRVAVPP
jgi:hypothetical protein